MSVHGSLSKSDVPFMPSWRHATVQISGDFVALLLRDVVDDTGAFIEIWNWTKATTQHRVRDTGTMLSAKLTRHF